MIKKRAEDQIEPTDYANRLGEMERVRHEYRLLNKRLASIHEWAPYIYLANKNADVPAIVERIKKRLVEIRNLEKKLGNLRRKTRRGGISIGGTRSELLTQLNLPAAALAGVVQSTQTSNECPELIEGTVENPTGVKEYFWDHPTESGPSNNPDSYGAFEWCRLRKQGYEELPSELVFENAETEAIGINGFIREDPYHILGGFPFGDITTNLMATIVCLQYTFPVPTCNSTLEWSCWPYVHLPEGISMWGDSHFADFDVVVREQLSGGPFPDFDDFDWVDGDRIETDVSSWVYGWRLSGQFNVQAGIQSKLCIGLGIQLWVEDGEIDFYSYESVPYGVLANRCIFTPTRVNMDFNDPPETWIRPGVGYKIRPR